MCYYWERLNGLDEQWHTPQSNGPNQPGTPLPAAQKLARDVNIAMRNAWQND